MSMFGWKPAFTAVWNAMIQSWVALSNTPVTLSCEDGAFEAPEQEVGVLSNVVEEELHECDIVPHVRLVAAHGLVEVVERSHAEGHWQIMNQDRADAWRKRRRAQLVGGVPQTRLDVARAGTVAPVAPASGGRASRRWATARSLCA